MGYDNFVSALYILDCNWEQMVFIFSTIVATLLTAKLSNFYVIGGLLSLALFSLIGIQDDYSKISKAKNSAGLSARGKLVLQFLSAAIIGCLIYFYGHTTDLYTPFYKFPLFEMGVFSIVFLMFIMVGSSNATNLTDGLDGLATVPSIMAFFTLSILVYITVQSYQRKCGTIPIMRTK